MPLMRTVGGTLKASLLSSALLFGAGGIAAAAEAPGYVNLPTDADAAAITEQLQELGYEDIRDVRHSGNVYEATAEWEGRTVALSVDERNGEITLAAGRDVPQRAAAAPDSINLPSDASAAEITERLQAAGYTNIRDIRESGDVYEATAEWQGRTVALTVEERTGGITLAEEREQFGAARDQIAGIPTRGSGTMDPDYVRSELQKLGFTDIQEIEESGDVFETAAMMDGSWVHLTVREDSGKIVLEDEPVERIRVAGQMTEAYVRQQLRALGYSDIDTVRLDEDTAEATARRDGELVHLRISETGDVIREPR